MTLRLLKSSIALLTIIAFTGCGFVSRPRVTTMVNDAITETLSKPSNEFLRDIFEAKSGSDNFFHWAAMLPVKAACISLATAILALHGGALIGPVAIDQSCRMVESARPAALETKGYLEVPFSKDNVLIRQATMLPRIATSPVVFGGAHLMYCAFPLDPDRERLFKKSPERDP